MKSLVYSSNAHKLISTAEDAKLGLWDIATERQEVLCEFTDSVAFCNRRKVTTTAVYGWNLITCIL